MFLELNNILNRILGKAILNQIFFWFDRKQFCADKKTRPNWARQVRVLIRVPKGQGVGLQGPMGSKGRPSGSQGGK